MLYNLLYESHRIFGYITVRSFLVLFSSTLIFFFLGKWFIEKIKKLSIKQYIREEGPSEHKIKEGTPTMGGLLILISTLIPSLLWLDLKNFYVQAILFSCIYFSVIGLLDDLLKTKRCSNKGLKGIEKLLLQILGGAIIFVFLYFKNPNITLISFPFFKEWIFNIKFLYFILFLLIVVGSSNAVNLTDGLDGLAIGTTLFCALAFSVLSYAAGNKIVSNYLQIPYVPGSGELAIFFAGLVGASLGFLWFNAPPAQIFMGDVGSLMLGGSIGVGASIIKQEFLLPIIGGIFVIEALSVMIQVLSYQLFGKRIFKMSPLHHHFEKDGIKETKIVIRFWILSILFMLIGLTTLKLR